VEVTPPSCLQHATSSAKKEKRKITGASTKKITRTIREEEEEEKPTPKCLFFKRKGKKNARYAYCPLQSFVVKIETKT